MINTIKTLINTNKTLILNGLTGAHHRGRRWRGSERGRKTPGGSVRGNVWNWWGECWTSQYLNSWSKDQLDSIIILLKTLYLLNLLAHYFPWQIHHIFIINVKTKRRKIVLSMLVGFCCCCTIHLTIAGEGLQNFDLCRLLTAFEQGGTS